MHGSVCCIVKKFVDVTHGEDESAVALPEKPGATTHPESPSRPFVPWRVPVEPCGHSTNVHVRLVKAWIEASHLGAPWWWDESRW